MAEKNKVVLEWNRWCTYEKKSKSFRLISIPQKNRSNYPPCRFLVEEMTEDLVGGTRWVSASYDEESIIHELVSKVEEGE